MSHLPRTTGGTAVSQRTPYLAASNLRPKYGASRLASGAGAVDTAAPETTGAESVRKPPEAVVCTRPARDGHVTAAVRHGRVTAAMTGVVNVKLQLPRYVRGTLSPPAV